MPVNEIDACVIHWLEQSYCPEGISEAKMEKLQLKIEYWIEEHENARSETV